MSEALRALRGAWRLAHADPGGLAFFDRSIDGFWRSFRAAAIVAPGHIVLLALRYAGTPAAGSLRVAAVEAICYVIGWVAYPLAMEPVSRLLGREREYVGYIVAYNWSVLVQVALLLLAILLAIGLPASLGDALVTGVQLALLLYAWLIARIALGAGALAAAAIVALDFALSYLIRTGADHMVYLTLFRAASG